MLRCGHRQKLSICLLFAVATSVGANAAPKPCTQAPLAVDEEKAQILSVINGMQDAWNRDFRGYMEGFKNPDVVFVSGGRFQDGWQGTLDHYIRDYGTSRGTLRFYDIQVEILAPDAAQLSSHFELLRPQHPQYGINTRLMRKVEGRWVIALNHVSATETPPPKQVDSPNPTRGGLAAITARRGLMPASVTLERACFRRQDPVGKGHEYACPARSRAE